ncbi:MAG TPA: EAL domain-containing protein [Burkholderiales bacterium]|nr:EAL domain-containing protein [Burkholderiales bacterium]
MSPHQLRDGGFIERITAARNGNISLDLEITENTLMEQIDEQMKRLAAMRELGVGIKIDDFGAGYSSLSYLTHLPVTGLKIDRSFISRMLLNDQNLKIVIAIIALADSLGLHVTAEGVETAAQWQRLQELECDAVQGYLLGRPFSADDAASLLRTMPVEEPH